MHRPVETRSAEKFLHPGGMRKNYLGLLFYRAAHPFGMGNNKCSPAQNSEEPLQSIC